MEQAVAARAALDVRRYTQDARIHKKMSQRHHFFKARGPLLCILQDTAPEAPYRADMSIGQRFHASRRLHYLVKDGRPLLCILPFQPLRRSRLVCRSRSAQCRIDTCNPVRFARLQPQMASKVVRAEELTSSRLAAHCSASAPSSRSATGGLSAAAAVPPTAAFLCCDRC